MVDIGVSVLCLSATIYVLCREFSPSLTSNIIWVVISWDLTSLYGATLISLKATIALSIYFLIASCHHLLPFSVSILYASFTDFGILIPYLCILCQYLDFTFASMASLFFHFCQYFNQTVWPGKIPLDTWDWYNLKIRLSNSHITAIIL